MRLMSLWVVIGFLLFNSCSKNNRGQPVLNQVDSLARAGNYLQAQVILYDYIKSNHSGARLDSLIRYYNWLGKQYKLTQKKELTSRYNRARRIMERLKHKMGKDIDDEGRITAYWYPGVSEHCYANVMVEMGKTPYLWLVFNDFTISQVKLKTVILECPRINLEFEVKPNGKTRIFNRSEERGRIKHHYRIVLKEPEGPNGIKLKKIFEKGRLNVLFEYENGLKRSVTIKGRAFESIKNSFAFFEAAYWLHVVPLKLKALSTSKTDFKK